MFWVGASYEEVIRAVTHCHSGQICKLVNNVQPSSCRSINPPPPSSGSFRLHNFSAPLQRNAQLTRHPHPHPPTVRSCVGATLSHGEGVEGYVALFCFGTLEP